jgi:SAM-dependent methyltransferase
MRIITIDDFIETYVKMVQRGSGFLASKFSFSGNRRTLSTFNDTASNASNWWLIPGVRRRWNRMITGDETMIYEDYVVNKYLNGREGLRLLSLGSGSCSHEINFALHRCFEKVICVDLAGNLLEKGRLRSRELKLRNMDFIRGDAHTQGLYEEPFDLILFHASLHHFRDVDKLANETVLNNLAEDGILVINEYVGPDRLQFPRKQIGAVNLAIARIPADFRSRFRMKLRKNRVSGPGIIRMYMADPSEARESARIMKTLERHMDPLEIKPYGGNILMLALKDIAHHFMVETPETAEILEELCEMEDEYIAGEPSDFVFAVFGRKKE